MTKRITTWVHHLADAMSAGRVLAYTPDRSHGDKIRAQMRRLGPALALWPVYVLQDDARTVFSSALVQYAHEHWAGLPYPAFLLEVSVGGLCDTETGEEDLTDRWIIGVSQHDADVLVMLWTTDHDPTEWAVDYGVAQVTPGTPQYVHHAPSVVHPDFEQQVNQSMEDAVGIFLSFMGLLNSPSVEAETVVPNKDSNRLRRLRKKAPVPTYTSVSLRLPKLQPPGYSQPGLHGTRARPRCHWRAGHDRHYPSGKVAHVGPTLVARRDGEEPPPPRYNVTRRPDESH